MADYTGVPPLPEPWPRPSIDTILMASAHIWSDRSTCSRAQVGAVLARDGRQIGSGYNGAPAGMDHCEHEPQPTFTRPPLVPSVPRMPSAGYDRGCKLATHAEANAISYAARFGIMLEGATIYTTLSPCYPCGQLIIAAGLVRVVFYDSYRDPAGIDLLRQAGLTVEKM